MAGKIPYKPEGYHTVTPYLVVKDVAKLIEFIKHAFDGKLTEQMDQPDGSITHAEMRIGDSVVMMGQASENEPPTTTMLYLYLEDTDAAYRQSLSAGASSLREPRDEFYGDRSAGVKDAFGNQWWMATHIEEVSPEEMQRRAAARAAQPG
jgi:PhnB protein